MSTRHVWLRVTLPQDEPAALRSEFPDVEFAEGEELDPGQLRQVEMLFTNVPATDELVERMPELRWLHTTRTAPERYLVPSVVRRSIRVTTSRGIHGSPFAEYALSCIFALAKRLPLVVAAQLETRWEKDIRTDTVQGKTVGIVGLGAIGSATAQMAKSLGMRVVATKRRVDEMPSFVDELWPAGELPQLLAQSDFVVMCIPAGESTEEMVGERELRSMRQSSFLISLTGGIKSLDEAALVRAVREGWIAGAAVNVGSGERLPAESELWGLPNVIISPGLAADDPAKWQKQRAAFVDNLKRFLQEDP